MSEILPVHTTQNTGIHELLTQTGIDRLLSSIICCILYSYLKWTYRFSRSTYISSLLVRVFYHIILKNHEFIVSCNYSTWLSRNK